MVFQTHDPVLQSQFFLFKSRDLKLVDHRLGGERPDGIVEIPMLNLELFQVLLIAIVVHTPFYTDCGTQVIVKKRSLGRDLGLLRAPTIIIGKTPVTIRDLLRGSDRRVSD